MKNKHKIKVAIFIILFACFNINVYADPDALPSLGEAECSDTYEVTTMEKTFEEVNVIRTFPGGPVEQAITNEENARKAENVTAEVTNCAEGEDCIDDELVDTTHREEVEDTRVGGIGETYLSEAEKRSGTYKCLEEVKDTHEEQVFNSATKKYDTVTVDSGTTHWVEVSPGACADKQIEKIETELNKWGSCVAQATVSYLDMNFYTAAPSGYKMYANKNATGDDVRLYLWNGTTSSPTLYDYRVSMNQIFVMDTVSKGIGFDPSYDTFNGYVNDSRFYDYYVVNVDNEKARYYNANGGKFYRIITESKKESIEDLSFDTAVDKDRGTIYSTRVRFQDDKWLRHISGVSYWTCNWYSESGGFIQSTSVSDSFTSFVNSIYAKHQEYYTMQEPVTIEFSKYKIGGSAKVLSFFPFNNADKPVLVEKSTQMNYINTTLWKDIEELAIANEQVIVYANYKRGHIEINKDTGIWTWEQHRQPDEIPGIYIVQPDIVSKTKISKYTVCMGQYNCDCADINILCSGEDEEVGLTKQVGCPNGMDCEGVVADNYGGNPNNPFGESKRVYNADGQLIPYGGPGGVTGNGSQDYYEKYLEGSATLVE